MCCTSDAAVKCDGHCLHGLSGVSSGSQDAYEACVMSVCLSDHKCGVWRDVFLKALPALFRVLVCVCICPLN